MKRIQRRRTSGWQMPPGAIHVARPSRWGNPFGIDMAFWVGGDRTTRYLTRRDSIALFTTHAEARLVADPAWLDPLRGHDLAFWCPLDQPCHADVLLELLAA